MKITFLGTSHGKPLENRYCSSTMVETQAGIYLIDCGAPVASLLIKMGKKFEDIKGIFISHSDGDHMDGLLDLLKLCSNRYKTTRFDVILTHPSLPQILEDYIASIDAVLPKDRINLKVASEGVVFDDNNAKVTYYANQHLKCFNRASYSMLFEAEGKRAIFTGDMSNHLVDDDFPKYALDNRVDFILSEMAHFEFTEIQPYMQRVDTKYFYFNHVNLPERKLLEIESASKSGKFPYPVLIANDGDSVEI